MLHINLMHINYISYKYIITHPQNHPILVNKTFCLKTAHVESWLSLPFCDVNPEGDVSWKQDKNGTWQLAFDNCYVNNINYVHIKQCVEQYRSVVFIGDSHIRFIFFYVIYKFDMLDYRLPRHLRDMYQRSRFVFVNTNFIEALGKGLPKTSIGISESKEKHVIIFSAGHWDLAYRGLTSFIANFYKVIKSVQIVKKKLPQYPS